MFWADVRCECKQGKLLTVWLTHTIDVTIRIDFSLINADMDTSTKVTNP
jgi:hypothetical protein